MTDSAPVTDRRDEIRAGEPFPESARPLLDANGNIVLETRGHPRVDALGRVLGPEAEPDLASAVVKAAKFDPRNLPPYSGTDPVAYVASLVGLTTVVKACDRADKATAAWADAEAQLRTARQELKQLARSARTDQAIQLNAGKSLSIPAGTTKAWREADERVRLLEAVLGDTNPAGKPKARPRNLRAMIVGDAIGGLSFDEAAAMLWAATAVSMAQASRHGAGLPPSPNLPMSTKEVAEFIFGVLPGSPSFMRDHPADRKRMSLLRRQLGEHAENLRRELIATAREKMLAAA